MTTAERTANEVAKGRPIEDVISEVRALKRIAKEDGSALYKHWRDVEDILLARWMEGNR